LGIATGEKMQHISNIVTNLPLNWLTVNFSDTTDDFSIKGCLYNSDSTLSLFLQTAEQDWISFECRELSDMVSNGTASITVSSVAGQAS
jgi:hypothetical protein